jgi:hypothetical protein
MKNNRKQNRGKAATSLKLKASSEINRRREETGE